MKAISKKDELKLIIIMCAMIRLKFNEILVKSMVKSIKLQRFQNLYTNFGVDAPLSWLTVVCLQCVLKSEQ